MIKEKNKELVIKNTIGMFDLIKGFMIVIMILLHTYRLVEDVDRTNPFAIIFIIMLSVFGGAAMPSLFVISGYGFRKTTFRKCLEKQLKTLLLPYVVTAGASIMLHFVSYYFLYGGIRNAFDETLKLFLGFLFGVTRQVEFHNMIIPTCSPVWFLLSLIIGNLILNQLAHHFSGNKLVLVAFVISCIGWLLGMLFNSPWGIAQGLVATLYICFGYYLKKNRIYTSANSILKVTVISIVSTGLWVILVVFGHVVNMVSSDYTYGPGSILLAGILSVVVIYWFLHLNSVNGPISNGIRIIGRNSIYVLCVHSVELMAIGRYVHYDFVNNWKGNVVLRSLIIFGVRLIVVLLATFLFLRFKDLLFQKKQKMRLSGKGDLS